MIDQLATDLLQWLTTPSYLVSFIVGLVLMGVIAVLASGTKPVITQTGDNFYSEYQKSVLLKKLNEK